MRLPPSSSRNTSPEQEENGGSPPPYGEQDRCRHDTELLEAARTRKSGRGIRRLVTLCGSITELIAENDRRLASNSDGESDDDNEDDEDSDGDGDGSEQEIKRRRNRDFMSYLQLIKLIPSLKSRIAHPHEGSRMLYYARLHDGANDARSDDISRVKSGVAALLNNRVNNPVRPPLVLDTRDGRGLQNDFTGRLLCPIKYDWDNPAVRANIRDHTNGYDVFGDYWIRCLYEREEGDPMDVEEGFLKSNLLVKTFQLIFTSPSSARGNLDAEEAPERYDIRRKSTAKRPSVAAQLQMDGQVTARALAYAAVQLHFSLNDATHWESPYNGFNYEEFYEFIIDFFEADQTPEGKAASHELLLWWNRRVFPQSPATRAASSRSARRSSLAVLRRQRHAAYHRNEGL